MVVDVVQARLGVGGSFRSQCGCLRLANIGEEGMHWVRLQFSANGRSKHRCKRVGGDTAAFAESGGGGRGS